MPQNVLYEHIRNCTNDSLFHITIHVHSHNRPRIHSQTILHNYYPPLHFMFSPLTLKSGEKKFKNSSVTQIIRYGHRNLYGHVNIDDTDYHRKHPDETRKRSIQTISITETTRMKPVQIDTGCHHARVGKISCKQHRSKQQYNMKGFLCLFVCLFFGVATGNVSNCMAGQNAHRSYIFHSRFILWGLWSFPPPFHRLLFWQLHTVHNRRAAQFFHITI